LKNPYPYGSGEHLAYEIRGAYGDAQGAFALWLMTKDVQRRNITLFLGDLLEKYGLEVAGFAALYLEPFDRMPLISEETRERITLMVLDFDEKTDPDLKRFKEWEDYE
jgi:hypothetical protein